MREFVERRKLETELKDLQQQLKTRIIAGENNPLKQVKKELQGYFSGKYRVFDVPLHALNTGFQSFVLQSVIDTKYGEAITYKEQSEKLNKSNKESAVATAIGANRLSIIVPCHRITGKNNTLTSDGDSLERNQWLLEHEKEHCADHV